MAKSSKANSGNTAQNDFTYILIYLFEWLTGIIFFIISGNDKRKKQHAIQAIILGVIAIIVGLFGLLGAFVSFVIWLYGLYIGYTASINEEKDIPYITDFAKKYV